MSGTDGKTGEQMDIPINLTMEIQELTSEDVVNLEAAVKLDMDKLVALLQREGALDAKAVTILNAFKDFRLQYILDVSKGQVLSQVGTAGFVRRTEECLVPR